MSYIRSVLLVLLTVLVAPCLTAAERPNILLILTDDMGYSDPHCYGGDFVPTPNIDRLAKEGTRFTQYYSASPVCSPSRTGILTGLYPARSRITSFLQTRAGNRACEQADFLDPKAPSIARTLKAAGYATAHIGKWHMGGGRDVTNAPLFSAYGFDEHCSTYESPEPDPEITSTDWIWSEHDNVKRWDRTGYFVNKTLNFLSRHKGQPCYVNLWPDDVHTPWVPQGTSAKKFKEDDEADPKFRLVLKEYDRQIGRLLDGLKELGMETNTIVIFTSDNGPLPTLDGKRAAGMRGSKVSLYEGGVRMPFIIKWPGHTPAGRVDDKSIFNAVDLFPTFCTLSGAALPNEVKFDGNDVSALFRGKKASHTGAMLWEYGRNTKGFHFPKGFDRSPNLAIRDGDWKCLVNADGTELQLYNLISDKAEQKNVAEKNPAVVNRLKQQVLAWRQSLP